MTGRFSSSLFAGHLQCRSAAPSRPQLPDRLSSISIKQTHRTSIFTARAENPIKRPQLSAIISGHALLFGQVLHGLNILAAHEDEHPRASIILAIIILRRALREVSLGSEAAKVGSIGRCGRGDHQKFRMAHLYPERCPSAGGMPGEKSAAGFCVHAILLF